ncbi:MAG TPA: ABC transporter ATP-binding protein [Limnochordales bacterium]
MLVVRGLHAGYRSVQVLYDVALTVSEGQCCALVGANGAGKTTLLRTLSGLLRPWAGTIEFGGERIDGREPHVIVEKGLVQVAEGRRLFPRMTVLENLRLGASTPRAASEREQNLERVFALFPRLKERQGQAAGTLSGGEQQMLAIGRALMASPRLLMLDEPSQGLAPKLVQQIFEVCQEINRQGIAVLLVEQNVQHALRIAHWAYVLENGRIVMEGPGSELLGDDALRRAYLGA